MAYKLIKRHENIDRFIGSIQEIKNKYDLIPDQATTTGGYYEGFSGWYNTRNDSPENEEFLSVVEELLRLININHIGSGILYADYYKTDDTDKYMEEVEDDIRSYIENNLWDDICNSEWSEDVD